MNSATQPLAVPTDVATPPNLRSKPRPEFEARKGERRFLAIKGGDYRPWGEFWTVDEHYPDYVDRVEAENRQFRKAFRELGPPRSLVAPAPDKRLVSIDDDSWFDDKELTREEAFARVAKLNEESIVDHGGWQGADWFVVVELGQVLDCDVRGHDAHDESFQGPTRKAEEHFDRLEVHRTIAVRIVDATDEELAQYPYRRRQAGASG
jgi:hypothetical protein